jgi:hypothetical protein
MKVLCFTSTCSCLFSYVLESFVHLTILPMKSLEREGIVVLKVRDVSKESPGLSHFSILCFSSIPPCVIGYVVLLQTIYAIIKYLDINFCRSIDSHPQF